MIMHSISEMPSPTMAARPIEMERRPGSTGQSLRRAPEDALMVTRLKGWTMCPHRVSAHDIDMYVFVVRFN